MPRVGNSNIPYSNPMMKKTKPKKSYSGKNNGRKRMR